MLFRSAGSGGGTADSGRGGLCDIVHMYALRSEQPPPARAGQQGSLCGRGRNREHAGGDHAGGGTELLYAISDSGIVGDISGDIADEIPVPAPEEETGGALKRRERNKFPWTGTGIKRIGIKKQKQSRSGGAWKKIPAELFADGIFFP